MRSRRTRRVKAALAVVLMALAGLVTAGSPAAASESSVPFRIDPNAPSVSPDAAFGIGRGQQIRLLRLTPSAATEHAKATAPQAGADAASVPPEDVTCTVSGSGPRRYDQQTIYFGVTLLCNGKIQQAAMRLFMYRNVAGTGWELFKAGDLERAPGTPFIVGLTRSDPVCLPANYIGMVYVRVDFLAGNPLTEEVVFATNSTFVGC